MFVIIETLLIGVLSNAYVFFNFELKISIVASRFVVSSITRRWVVLVEVMTFNYVVWIFE